jgi:hypothetical protein
MLTQSCPTAHARGAAASMRRTASDSLPTAGVSQWPLVPRRFPLRSGRRRASVPLGKRANGNIPTQPKLVATIVWSRTHMGAPDRGGSTKHWLGREPKPIVCCAIRSCGNNRRNPLASARPAQCLVYFCAARSCRRTRFTLSCGVDDQLIPPPNNAQPQSSASMPNRLECRSTIQHLVI